MTKRYDFFKMMHGKSLDDVAGEIPSAEDFLHQTVKRLTTRYPLRLLGTSQNGQLHITEEERAANFHILGEPEQGKSKFLEYHIRRDIDMGNGLCLLDPSDSGDTREFD